MKTTLPAILSQLLRPLGEGIPTFSAGKGAAHQLQREHYRHLLEANASNEADDAHPLTAEQIQALWKESWAGLARAQLVLIGIPFDTGAGIRRGAAYGPRGVREELLKMNDYRELIRSRTVIDLGDVFVNPHLLHDEMLNKEQIQACREAMYPTAEVSLRSILPVSALSQVKLLLSEILKAFPHLRIQIIGGDHSVAWPVVEVLAERFPNTLGIVQPDAHTDLLSTRLGVKYCFGTWSYHANRLIGANGKMVQLGIRQSGKEKAHWESTTGVKQYWAQEILSRPEDEMIAEIVAHLRSKGVRQVYFSNDVDGTDESEISATGTPASGGLTSSFILKTIRELGSHFELVAGDVVEVAPDLGHSLEASERTCKIAAQYTLASIQAQLATHMLRHQEKE